MSKTRKDRIDLNEKQHEALEQARKLLDKAVDESDETRAAELREESDKYMAEVESLEERIKEYERLDEAEAKLNERQEKAAKSKRPKLEKRSDDEIGKQLGEPDDAESEYSEVFFKMLRNQPLNNQEQVVLSRSFDQISIDEMRDNPELRAQAAGTNTAGGYTVPVETSTRIIERMKMFGPMNEGGPCEYLVTRDGHRINFPTVDDTSSTGEMKAENAAVTEGDVTFGQKSIDAYMFSSKMIRVPVELLQDSNQMIESYLSRLLGERIGRGLNQKLTSGSGTNEPNGIITATSAGKTTASATAITFDEVLDLVASVDPAYRYKDGRTGFMMHDAICMYARKIKNSNNDYIWQMRDVRADTPDMLWGYPVWVNQDMDSAVTTGKKTMLFGSFSNYMTRRVRGMTMSVARELFIQYLQIALIAWIRADGELLDANAVKHMVQA